MLINCDGKFARETPENSTFAHKAWKPRSYNTPSFTGDKNQHNQPNGVKFKTNRWMQLSVTQVGHFTQLLFWTSFP
jgi:hypothetical protein